MAQSGQRYTHIHLGHGSGGLMTRELLDDIIFKTFSNPYLDQKHDGAILDLEGPLAISTDSFVVSPVFFKGGNIGELAVNGTVNDVAMCGAIPQYLTLSFIVEEGLPLEEFLEIVTSIKKTADECGVQVVTGDTKVVERGKGDKIFINTTGVGKVHSRADISAGKIRAGDKVLVNGFLAQHGMAIMSQREGLEFESSIESDTTHLHFLVRDLLDAFGEKIHLFRDPTRGGLASVLTEIASDIKKGVVLKEDDLPLEKQVAAACEILGLDPLYVANEGVLVVVVAAEIEKEVLSLMRRHPKGIHAASVGTFTEEHPSKVVMQSSIGGKRVVSPLLGEQLPRIC